jgi:glycosyltransferase involved in cell wall biosynthesis
MAAHRLAGKRGKLVLTITNDLYHGKSPSNFGRWFSVKMLWRTYPIADYIVTLTDHMRRDLCNDHGIAAQKLVTIPPSVDLDEIQERARATSALGSPHPWLSKSRPHDIPVLLHVGRISKQKD